MIARLQKEGYKVTAVQIPLTALADDVARVRTVLAAQSGPTITVPAWYLVTENDQTIPAPAQQFMAQRMGATVSAVASSHVPMLSDPDPQREHDAA